MSEISTGAVSLSLIGAPIAIAAAGIGAAGYAIHQAGKYVINHCQEKYAQMLADIEATDQRVKWLNNQMITSPAEMKKYAAELQSSILGNEQFKKYTAESSQYQKELLAGIIATNNSPMGSQYIKAIQNNGNQTFDEALSAATHQVSQDCFNYLNRIVQETAIATGFSQGSKFYKNTDKRMEAAFKDANGRVFTMFSNIAKNGNPNLTLDLEGFACDEKACTGKMDEIIKHLRAKGIPFQYKRLKHNQPEGMLRKMLSKLEKKPVQNNLKTNKQMDDYLRGNSTNLSEAKANRQ